MPHKPDHPPTQDLGVIPIIQGIKAGLSAGRVPPQAGVAEAAPAPLQQNFVPNGQTSSVASRFAGEQFATEQAEQQQRTQDRKKAFFNFLLKAGVPLGAAIAGSINPDLLPAAAGLSQGFVKGTQRAEDRADKKANENKKLILRDKEGNVIKEIDVGQNEINKIVNQGTTGEDFVNIMSKVLDLEIGSIDTEETTKKVKSKFSGEGARNFSSVEEAEAANLPVGTEVTINGRRAIIE